MADKHSTSSRQMYRNLVIRLRNLVVHPAEEWSVIREETTAFNDLLANFSLPLIGLVTLTTFLNFLINQQALIFELALKQALLVFSSFFVGLLAAYYLIQQLLRWHHVPQGETIAAKLTAYSSAPLYLVSMITSLVPEVFFIQVLSLYSFYIGWVGISGMDELSDDKKALFAILLAVTILAAPLLIRLLLFNLLSI